MSVTHAIILGVIQGLTEILPISSSAHLVVIPWFLKWQYQGLSFDIALHAGTALALGIYFRKDWMGIFKAAFTKDAPRKNNMLMFLALGTVPGAAAGLILEKKAETIFRSPLVIAVMLAAFAVILWLADHFGGKKKAIGAMSLRSAITIGLAQAIAIIPGVSRSGITMTAGLFEGFSRETAARFSFLLATPIVLAAAVLKLPKLHAGDFNTAFWAGVISSGVSGFAAIHLLLKFVQKYSLNVFVIYRIAFAVLVLIFIMKG